MVAFVTLETTSTNATAPPQLYHTTDSKQITKIYYDAAAADPSSGTIAAGRSVTALVTMRQSQIGSTRMLAMSQHGLSGFDNSGAPVNLATAWTGSWELALRHEGVGAGGRLYWKWSVYKVVG